MDTDNLYPHPTNLFKPTKREEKAKSDFQQRMAMVKEKIAKEKPFIEQACDHLRQSIDFYRSVDSVPQDSLFDRRKANHVLAANKIVVQVLVEELKRLEGILRQLNEPR